MSKITSIATAVPHNKHSQNTLFQFANKVYSETNNDTRKLQFLYNHSGIEHRYSIIPDFDLANEHRIFFAENEDLKPVPSIEKRMELYNQFASNIAVEAIEKCIFQKISLTEITHLITVSCTGMSAPGLDLQIVEQLQLSKNIVRTSVNFMGCYAAIHAMKLANAFCNNDPNANVIIVCTEFCTLHFQSEPTVDNITSSLLFGDGCAAVLMQPNNKNSGIKLENFYSEVNFNGKNEMAWEIASTGFLMTLTGHVPEIIKTNFKQLVSSALEQTDRKIDDVTKWCIHPGGKKIVDVIADSLSINKMEFKNSYDVLNDYGNMSSPTILFVLQKIMNEINLNKASNEIIFGAAFGPGLTMETFTAVYE